MSSFNPMNWGLWTAYDLAIVAGVIILAEQLNYITVHSTGMTAVIAMVGIPVISAVKEYLL